jgi:oligoribonuclease
MATDKLLWIDMEMTGLDIEKEVIIEVAAIVTDWEFKELDTYHAVVKQPQEYLDRMDDWNTEHHGASGLTALVAKGKDQTVVENELLALISKHFGSSNKERPIIAGNSIAQDRLFITKYMKSLNAALHYRMLDVSSWKIVYNDKFKIKYEKENTHRALDDIRESIAELKYYTERMAPTPKPT